MNQLVWTGPEKMILEKGVVPTLHEDEVLIKVEAVGICGSEIEGFLGHNSLRKPPLVMGHEFCGRIDQIGENVKRLQNGTKVVVNPLLSCGICSRCIQGKENLCDHRQIIGIHRPGAFAQKVAVPASVVHTVPETLNSVRAALAEPLACSLRAARRALAVNAFSNVIVFGAGTIGLLCSFVAVILGAGRVIIMDKNSARLETAKSVGLEYTLNPSDPDVENQLKRLVGSKGADVVIDAAGFQKTREDALRFVNPGGTFMNIGLGIDDTNLKINHTIRHEINILGSFCYSRQDFADAIGLLAEGTITEEGWTEVRGLSEGQRSFMDLVEGKVANGKILMNPNF